MLDVLFNEIINDAAAPQESTRLNETHTLTESKEAEFHRRITAMLRQIEGDGARYLEYRKKYIQDCQERCARDSGPC
jgi:hypothetical protein